MEPAFPALGLNSYRQRQHRAGGERSEIPVGWFGLAPPLELFTRVPRRSACYMNLNKIKNRINQALYA